MIADPPESGEYQVSDEVFERLAAATAAERTELLLQLIGEHPGGRVRLPARGELRAVLDEIDLSGLANEVGRGGAGESVPADSESPSAGLRGADFQGASLRKVNLQGVDLSTANLRGALLGKARLAGAQLERADFSGADLAGADLQGASLGEADLRGAMLEEAILRDAALRYAKLGDAVLENANLQGADLWGADLRAAVLTNANLRDVCLEEANLQSTDMVGADLQGAVLRRADLRGANLRGVDLRGALLGDANLEGASLRDARLQEADLSHCNITHIHLSGARLDGARLRSEQLGGAIGEELAGQFGEARRGYLVLERAFAELGDPDAVRWAYQRRRRMQKQEALERGRAARRRGDWHAAVASYAEFVNDQLVEWLCDYGESIPRILASIAVLYLVFGVLYAVTGSVVREDDSPAGVVRVMTRNPIDLAIFSLLAMTTGSIGIRFLPRNDLALTLVGIHLFLGIALIGLLGFVLGNRIRR